MSTPVLSVNTLTTGNTLYQWLGTFWQRIYKDPQFAKAVTGGFGLQAAQYYLDYLERLNLLNRNNIPVLHRERWRMVTLLRSQVGTGDAVKLRVGMDPTPNVGPQEQSGYAQNAVFTVGGYGTYANAVSYPLDADLKQVVTCITSDVLNPAAVLVSGSDFVVEDATVVFIGAENDPFTNPAFAKTQLRNADGTEDTAISVWCCDALYDKDYVYRFLSYALGMRLESTEYHKAAVNAVWDFYNQSATRLAMNKAIGAILDEDVLPEDATILSIEQAPAENKWLVETSIGYFSAPLTATLNPALVVGAQLRAGTFITDHVRIYGAVDPLKLAAYSEWSTRFVDDVSALCLDKSLFRAPIERSIGLDWKYVPIVQGAADGNGNPKLSFEVYGSPGDTAAFWEDFWSYCELHNLASETCFSDYLNDILSGSEGTIRGYVKPMEFFLRYFLKYNTVFVVIDRSKLSEVGRSAAMLLSELKRGMPAHTLLMMIERLTVGSDPYTLAELDETVSPALVHNCNETARAGTAPTSAGLVYLDRKPIVRWLPECATEAV